VEKESRSIFQERHSRLLNNIHQKYNSRKKIIWISWLCLCIEFTFDLYIFCNGIVHPSDRIFIIEQSLIRSDTTQDHEYFNIYFGGLFHLSKLLELIQPDCVFSIDDSNTINRQAEILDQYNIKYIAHVYPRRPFIQKLS